MKSSTQRGLFIAASSSLPSVMAFCPVFPTPGMGSQLRSPLRPIPQAFPSPTTSSPLIFPTKASTSRSILIRPTVPGGWSSFGQQQQKKKCLHRYSEAFRWRRHSTAIGSPSAGGDSSDMPMGVELPPYNQRPNWAPFWVPTWAVTLHPIAQAAVMTVLYFFHMLVLSKVAVPFPFQLLPNTHGLFQSIGLDSLAGFMFLAILAYFRKAQGLRILPTIYGERPLPFDPPVKGRSKVWRILAFLMIAYLTSGSASKWVEDAFSLSEVNIALGRAVQVLAGHLVWVALGVLILKTNASPFFGKASRWMKSSWKTYWLWWAIGGYYVSSLAFHVADTVNQLALPASAFEVDSVVTQMINPEGNDIIAMLVGSLAPCVSAPWWEEVLYRGFLLPALYLFYPPDVATFVSAIIFAAHHMSLSGMIPLTTLGYLWAVLYILSGNLLVPILIHAMWNSRVFLGSLLGI